MDTTDREILIMVLERLRHFESKRQEDLSTLIALVRTVCSASPRIVAQYRSELAEQQKKAADPALSTEAIYDELIRLLKDPSLPETAQQEKLRRLLETFDGTVQ
jgi:hypothetical protein